MFEEGAYGKTEQTTSRNKPEKKRNIEKEIGELESR